MSIPVPKPPPKQTLVFDTTATVAWLTQHVDRWERIDKLLRNPRVDAVLPSPAVAETLYVLADKGNTATTGEIVIALRAHLRFEPVNPSDGEWAGDRIKESRAHPVVWPAEKEREDSTLSLGDGLILAVAHRLNAHSVTFDAAWARFPTMKFPLLNAWKIR